MGIALLYILSSLRLHMCLGYIVVWRQAVGIGSSSEVRGEAENPIGSPTAWQFPFLPPCAPDNVGRGGWH